MCLIKVGDLAKYNKKPKPRKLTLKEKTEFTRQIIKATGLNKSLAMLSKYTR